MAIYKALLILASILPLTHPSLLQTAEPQLVLGLNRNFGYRGGNRIQGAFTLQIREAPEVVQVTFLIDNRVMETMKEAPFSTRFNTADYPLGPHTFSAIGLTSAGEERLSNRIEVEFVSAETSWQTAQDIVVPLLFVIIIIGVFATLVPALLSRGGGFQPGVYGTAGGAVCPRCSLPFSRHFLALNLVFGKLERCPHCGKWAIVARARSSDLAAAEARWQANSQGDAAPLDDDDQRLRRAVDESRFED